MPIGASNRVVLELPSDLKRQLYSALAAEGLTLKQWFAAAAVCFVEAREIDRQKLIEPSPRLSAERTK